MPILSVLLPPVVPTAGTEFGYVLSQGAHAVTGHGIAALALLPAADQIHLIVPAQRVSWHVLKLPPVPAGRLRQVLDGLLEDRLLDEPAQLALAVGLQRAPDGASRVAACPRPWLAACLSFFEHAQRPAARVLPEFAPLDNESAAAEPVRCFVTGTAEEAWLTRVDAHSCVQVPLAQAAVLLGWPGPTDAAAAHTGAVTAEPEVAALAEQVLQRPVDVRPAAERLLATSHNGWELAQFDLALSGSGRVARRWAQGWQQFGRQRAWRPVRFGLALLVAANLVGLNVWAWHQRQQVAAREAQLKTVFTQSFPRVRTVVDAPLQMARELQLLRQGSGALAPGDMELMLGALGAALPEGLAPSALDFAAGELRAEGLVLDAPQWALAQARLAGAGLSAQYEAGRLTLRLVASVARPAHS